MNKTIKQKIIFFIFITFFVPNYLYSKQIQEGDSSNVILKTKANKRFRVKIPLSLKKMTQSIISGERKVVESIFRPLEFREPIRSIPAEGKFGLGFYGLGGIDKRINMNEGFESIKSNNILSSFYDFEFAQTNLSYLFFKKSYADILTGVGLRRFSPIFTKPKLPESWGINRKFSPTILEMNIVTSYIIMWQPSWFIQLKYSYGTNFTRFYQNKSMDLNPYSIGLTSSYSIGIKRISETMSNARYSWGLELRHSYNKFKNVRYDLEPNPIKSMIIPNYGIFFTLSAFYGGNKTSGDEAKKMFLNKDYISAKNKIDQFLNQYPNHSRSLRAKKLLKKINERIPGQLFKEANKLKLNMKIDRASDKYLEAMLNANDFLKPKIAKEIEKISDIYILNAKKLFNQGLYDKALEEIKKAAAISDNGIVEKNRLEAEIIMKQGDELELIGLHLQAIKKYNQVPDIDRTLSSKAYEATVKSTINMLNDVNQAKDITTLRLALKSLKTAELFFKPAEFKYKEYIEVIQNQLTYQDSIEINEEIRNSTKRSRKIIEERNRKKVSLGMILPEVEEILGKPTKIINTTKKNKNYQMWIYELENINKTFYFEDYILFKIEN